MIVECPGCRSRYDVTGRPPGTRARCRCGSVFALPAAPKSAGQLACPGCGANAPPTDHQCSFCSFALKIKACPRCFAQIFHASKHCDMCGAKVVRPAEATIDGEARIRDCPRCAVSLDARVVGDVLIDECPECLGLYLDASAVESVVRERRQATAQAIIGMPRIETSESASVSSERLYIKCPDCDQIMNRVNFGRRSGVIVDVCRPHGTWFDQDELPRVIDFVMTGGLEESERREVERLRDEARLARSEVRGSAQMGAVGGAMMGASGGLGGGLLRSSSGDVFGALLGAIGSLLVD